MTGYSTGASASSSIKEVKKINSCTLCVFAVLILLALVLPWVEPAHSTIPTTKYWALIVSGSDSDPEMSFGNNTDYMYHVLTQRYSFDGIYYLHTDIDAPNVDDNSTLANVRWAITTWLRERSDANDVVFIYFTSHGTGMNRWRQSSSMEYPEPHWEHLLAGGRYDTSGDEGSETLEAWLYLNLYDPGLDEYFAEDWDANGDGDLDDWVGVDESFFVSDTEVVQRTVQGRLLSEVNSAYWDDDLATDLDTLSYGTLIFVAQGCFSGGLIDDISAPNRIIMTACEEDSLSWEDQDGDSFSEWSEVFMDALYGQNTHAEGAGTIIDDPEMVYADTDFDGRVSMKEAWDYAEENDDARTDEWPWLDDNGDGIPTFLDGGYYGDWGFARFITEGAFISPGLGPGDGALASQTWLREGGGIESCDSTGAKKDIFDPGDEVYVASDVPGYYAPSTSYNIYIVEDVTTWTIYTTIPSSVVFSTVSSDASGNIPTTLVWSSASSGRYDIVVDVDGDGVYDRSDGLDNGDIWTAGFCVVTTIESCDALGVTQDSFFPSEDVYVVGSGYFPSILFPQSFPIYVVEDTTWTDGMPIPSRVPGTATSVSSNAAGNVGPTLVWSSPLISGRFDIVVDVNKNGLYDEDIDALDDLDIEASAGFSVVLVVDVGASDPSGFFTVTINAGEDKGASVTSWTEISTTNILSYEVEVSLDGMTITVTGQLADPNQEGQIVLDVDPEGTIIRYEINIAPYEAPTGVPEFSLSAAIMMSLAVMVYLTLRKRVAKERVRASRIRDM